MKFHWWYIVLFVVIWFIWSMNIHPGLTDQEPKFLGFLPRLKFGPIGG